MSFSSHYKEVVSWIVGTLVVAAVLFIAGELITNPGFSIREPASIFPALPVTPPTSKPSTKQETLLRLPENGIHTHGKGSGLVSVSIQSLSGSMKEPGSIIQLEASVQALVDVDTLEYVWIIPEGIEVSNGAREGTIGTLQESQISHLNLTVVSTTSENRQIHLHVFRKTNGEAMGAMAQFNTVDQDEINEALRTKADVLRDKNEREGTNNKLVL